MVTLNENLKREYQRELKNAKARIKRLENIGYHVENPLPKKPKRITEASIRSLHEKTQRKNLVAKSVFTSQTGEQIKGKKAYEKKLKNPVPKKTEKPSDRFYKGREKEKGKRQNPVTGETYEVLDNTLKKIRTWTVDSTWSPSLMEWKTEDKNKLERMLDAALERDGREAVADRLQKNAEVWNAAVDEILYGSGGSKEQTMNMRSQIDHDFITVATILKGSPLTQEESIEVSNMQESQEINN